MPIANAEEVEQVFDAISYCKGGSVVRMVHAVVGKDKFVQGLRAYMEEFKYGNATTGDLWKAWEVASGKPVTDMMGQWTTQMGFPLLEVVEAAAAGGGVTLKLKQSWFLADGSAPAAGEEKLWMIPVFAAASGGAAGAEASLGSPDFMFAAQSEAQMTLPGDGAWVKLNFGQHVPLRVKYPDSMISPLCAAITAKAFPAADRIGLLSDQAALSRAGRLDPAKYLELLAAYQNEDDATVWSQLLEQLLSLHRLLQGSTELQAAFDSVARALLLPKLAELGWTPRAADAHLERKLRGELISALPAFGSSDAEVMAEARRRFDAFVADSSGDALPSEYQQAVYKLVLSAGGEAEFEQLLTLFDTLPLNDQKKAALAALGAAPTDALRVRALEFALSEAVKTQDRPHPTPPPHAPTPRPHPAHATRMPHHAMPRHMGCGARATRDLCTPSTPRPSPRTRLPGLLLRLDWDARRLGRGDAVHMGLLPAKPAAVHRQVRPRRRLAHGRRHRGRVRRLRHRGQGGGGQGLLRGQPDAAQRAHDRAEDREHRHECQVPQRFHRLGRAPVAQEL